MNLANNDAERISQAWTACYLDPLRARQLGLAVAKGGRKLAGEGWLHVALVELRMGDAQQGLHALDQARTRFAQAGDRRGLALCDEAMAIRLRRQGDVSGAQRMQAEIDQRGSLGYSDADRYVAFNSRALTHKLLGEVDPALHYFYAAAEAAQSSGIEGMRVAALTNLGGYHQDLFNLEDARSISEEALRAARAAKAPMCVATAAVNLIVAYHACGQLTEARAMAGFLVDNPEELLPGDLKNYPLALALAHLGVGEISAAQGYLDRGAVAPVGDGVAMWTWLQTRCLLAQGDATRARALAASTLAEREARQLSDMPYETMQLLYAAADACEQLGDAKAALGFVRSAHCAYERLVGSGARARRIALQADHELAQAKRERDVARDSHRSAEDDRLRLVQLNEALQAQVLETEMLHTRLREQALRDPLTGLHNRRYLFEMAPGLLDLARRQNTPLCVVLIDLDHFKLLNDTFGHHAGDAVLQRFASLLAQMLRRSDVVCRHGGEEFVAVMPDIDVEGAQHMLNRLLEAYQAQQQDMGRRKLPSCSFSAGIATFPMHGSSLELLLSRADRALYNAKASGRARIETMPMTDFGTFR